MLFIEICCWLLMYLYNNNINNKRYFTIFCLLTERTEHLGIHVLPEIYLLSILKVCGKFDLSSCLPITCFSIKLIIYFVFVNNWIDMNYRFAQISPISYCIWAIRSVSLYHETEFDENTINWSSQNSMHKIFFM